MSVATSGTTQGGPHRLRIVHPHRGGTGGHGAAAEGPRQEGAWKAVDHEKSQGKGDSAGRLLGEAVGGESRTEGNGAGHPRLPEEEGGGHQRRPWRRHGRQGLAFGEGGSLG